MNITKENTGAFTATLKIEIGPSDYTVAVEKQIHDHKRKSNIPGFRPGHIPTGLIKKMYGKAILADEVNKVLSDSLLNYIKEENLDILGNPLPNLEKNAAIDFENQTDFEFYFDLGLSPEFTLKLNEDIQIEYNTIRVDDEMIDKYIENMRKRYGKPSPSIPGADGQASDQNLTDVATEKAEEPIVIPTEMNPDFFHQVYPSLNIETEEDFRTQVKKDAESNFITETDKLFFNLVTETLVKNTEIDIPDTFLKRWLLENNKGKYTTEEIDRDYNSFAESMKWQLIENKIIKDFGIEVKDEDIRQYIRTFFLRQVGPDTGDPEMEKRYESIVDKFMENKDQVQRINDQLYNAKLMKLFKKTLTLVSKEVTYDDFIKLASAMHDHSHDHEHQHGHDHDKDNDNELEN